MDLYMTLGLMCLAVAAGLAGMMHAVYTSLVKAYHDVLYTHPLTGPRTPVERFHMRSNKACADCSFHAGLRSIPFGVAV
jgi:hypothetical protein